MHIIRNTCAVAASLFAFSGVTMADASVAGLQLGKTTIQELQNKYDVEMSGINEWSKGEMYTINKNDIAIEGLKDATAIFSKDGKLEAVLLTISDYRFDDLAKSLKKKYKVVKSVKPFVGDALLKLKDGNTTIELNDPHMSFDMTLSYIQDDFEKSYQKQSKAKQRQKQDAEADLL